MQPNASHTGLEVNVLRPTTCETVCDSIGYPIDTAVRTSRRGPRNKTIPTRMACAVDIEESDAIAFGERTTLDVVHSTANPLQSSDTDMTGNDRVGDAAQSPVAQVYVRAAHFTELHLEQRRVRFQVGQWQFAQLAWPRTSVRPGWSALRL